MKPKIIIFEGVDYAGKSGCIAHVKEVLENLYPGKVKAYRNPGGTVLGEKVRDIARIETKDVEEQLLAYLLAITSVRNAVKEDIENGCIVLLDRWVQSTLVYQVSLLPPHLKEHYKSILVDKLDWSHTELIHFTLGFSLMTDRMRAKQDLRTDTVDRFEAEAMEYRYKVWSQYQTLILSSNEFSKNQTVVYSSEYTETEQKDHALQLVLNLLGR